MADRKQSKGTREWVSPSKMPLLALLPTMPQNFKKISEPLQWLLQWGTRHSAHEPVGIFPIQAITSYFGPQRLMDISMQKVFGAFQGAPKS